ncbi:MULTISPECIES: exodeoxyribonuclease VII large subunit [unclassified Acidovorax]|uniref:exodeoxyribonuclease VII large subunit n=1 Tax=unclassified Acidovorax TaxID=2684926 RepID=UPI001C453965|nr:MULTISPECIES: exodeoxyribonuclease VII large subunit [unclassified Acidovorax]MBV7427335.1 exodeoxyribonuclease VII large subunit [Acidovorax sp. sif0732]MBV7448459.1 exodeoxyribonuclease VII large subunit [Acidovorax sp. sif0715]
MSRQYLNVPFAQKDAAKSLGARFDGAVKRWYVDEGRDLAVFAQWLPTPVEVPSSPSPSSTDLALPLSEGALALPRAKGIPLSRLLNGVASAVAQAFSKGVWTLVEVVEARVRGHVYLELSERDGSGQPVAKARAMIWSATAARILPEFEKATGAVIGAGIKLLVLARPVFHAQFGFSLEIEAIDPEYTLGDLEARKREIRERLQREGVFEHNRRLEPPWDYRCVLVVAPEDAAGLGDFRKESERLERFGVCRFVYAHSRFQGEGAAREIVSAIVRALEALPKGAPPDAIALIRGGGAVNDLAWLNDYDLARFICDQDIPVLTGIGHERDNTLPDEVAHQRFDTPSKVIAGIEHQILQRTREARMAAEAVFTAAGRLTQRVRAEVDRSEAQVRADAQAHLARARHGSSQAMSQVEVASMRQVHEAAARSLALWNQTQDETRRHLAAARQQVPTLLHDVRARALASVAEARGGSELALHAVVERGRAATRAAGQAMEDRLQRVAERAHGRLQAARNQAEALMREVTGQGPEKTLARGFAIVRTPEGKPVTDQAQARALPALEIQFRDGVVPARRDDRNQKE